MITGRSLVAGIPVGPRQAGPHADVLAFRALNPATGEELPTVFYSASSEEIRDAGIAAARAYSATLLRSAQDRAALLAGIAAQLDDIRDDVISIASKETGLSSSRLGHECERATSTLRMFADLVRDGSWVRAVVDPARAAAGTMCSPDLRLMLRPLGPVAVFGASNFPLAYSTAGTDTSSALAAGCPVIVKGHPSHPATGEMVAHAIVRAVDAAGFDPGLFSFLHSGGGGARESAVGRELVQLPMIRAVGFTGSYRAGTAIEELCRARTANGRPDPIPMFAEMGSTNPVFVLPALLERRAKALAATLFASMTNSAGQMCTCPGLIVIPETAGAAEFVAEFERLVSASGGMTMLSFRVREGYHERVVELVRTPGVTLNARGALATSGPGLGASSGVVTQLGSGAHSGSGSVIGSGLGSLPNRPALESVAMVFSCSLSAFRTAETVRDECFGPSTVIVRCPAADDLIEAAELIRGSLTASVFTRLHADDAVGDADRVLAVRLLAALERRAGRIVFDGVPTGVAVSPAMVHGGPFPATNQPHATAVGPHAVERWCRPVCYQNVPTDLLSPELRDENPMNVQRWAAGTWGRGPLPPRT
jgi:2,5-dioxopentanoate dehydrogenase